MDRIIFGVILIKNKISGWNRIARMFTSLLKGILYVFIMDISRCLMEGKIFLIRKKNIENQVIPLTAETIINILTLTLMINKIVRE
jgi:hypothetical protein